MELIASSSYQYRGPVLDRFLVAHFRPNLQVSLCPISLGFCLGFEMTERSLVAQCPHICGHVIMWLLLLYSVFSRTLTCVSFYLGIYSCVQVFEYLCKITRFDFYKLGGTINRINSDRKSLTQSLQDTNLYILLLI